jgi:hypothetical protein
VPQQSPGAFDVPAPTENFPGLSWADDQRILGNWWIPPDTQGDVGPHHYVQIVNDVYAVYDKRGNLLYGPAAIASLWKGHGDPCETSGFGDPIALYDHLADRWLISEMAYPDGPPAPSYECIAISQTGDPAGAYYAYTFLISQTKMNDYPKLAVWPDAYYMSMNQFCDPNVELLCTPTGWGGQGVVAFERDKMLAGQVAQAIYKDLYTVDPNLGGMLPSELDGPPPPSGAPNYYVEFDDDAWGVWPDQLQMWQFHVDWTDPSASTFTHTVNLGTAPFDSNMCDYSLNCIPQPSTSQGLDAISDRLMYRLQYRNFGTYRTLVASHTVDVDGTDHAGIRWYELRNTGSGWAIRQQSTYSPDAAHRWMGSMAMDDRGDIALGYSVSSNTIYPSIRYTGRQASDPLGTMGKEVELIAGTGSQTHAAGRWGDYSMMSVDPTEDCTFWYTQEYYDTTSRSQWLTRIGSFSFCPARQAARQPVGGELLEPELHVAWRFAQFILPAAAIGLGLVYFARRRLTKPLKKPNLTFCFFSF